MTADEFSMNYHRTILKDDAFKIQARDGEMELSFDVFKEDIEYTLSENFEHFADFFVREAVKRAEGLWDGGRISDDEYNMFKTVLEMML